MNKKYLVEIKFSLREVYGREFIKGWTYASSDTEKGLIRNIKANYGRIANGSEYSAFYEEVPTQLIWLSESKFELPKDLI